MRKLSPKDFRGQELKTDAPTGVLFETDWCPYCKAFKPGFIGLRPEGFKLAIADLSGNDNPLWEIFSIDVVPTLIAFKDGEIIWRKDGVLRKGLKENDLDEMVNVLR